MILEVQHETRLEYTEAVAESIAEVRMEPVCDADQSCRSFHLAVTPATNVFRYVDGFGNRVHHFNVMPANGELRFLAASVIETHPRTRNICASKAIYPLNDHLDDLRVLDYLQLRGPVRDSPRLEALAEELRPRQGSPLGEAIKAVSDCIHNRFEYAKYVTLATSPIDDLLEYGKGVCQDFTHLMIGVLRRLGVPARYVSGYIHYPEKESQSHAWCEAWLPDLGWVGIDPTNGRAVDDRFVKVAIGRDFTDVTPNKGLFRGRADQSIFVRVETRQLDVLPSLSWQEQLPPLHTPLTAIVSSIRGGEVQTSDEHGEQQQQQQQ